MVSLAQVFDVSLIATIALIFFLTMLGANIRSRRRDICLKSFCGYPVTVERADGRVIWGVMELESTGLELRYVDSVQDANHLESSYLLYASEFADIQAMYRYEDELSDEDKRRRERHLERYFHPGPLVRLVRSTQHFFALAGDSMTEVLGMIMGSLRKPAGRYITDASEEHLKRFSSTLVGSVGAAFDPLLERLIGQKVVFDLLEGDEVHEHVGIFKNYSPDFIEMLDVQYPERRWVDLHPNSQVDAKCMTAVFEQGVLHITNNTEQPLLVHSLVLDDEEDLLNVVVDGGESIDLHPEGIFTHAKLNINVVRELDIIMPRSRCVVRHRAERYEREILSEIIFDIGVRLRGDSLLDAREQRLRKRLKAFPDSALAASNLGSILLQKRQFGEAKQWLTMAYAARFSLPDNGRRTLMMLHELERAMSKSTGSRTVTAVAVAVGERPSEAVAGPVSSAMPNTSATIVVDAAEGHAGAVATV